MKTRRFFSVPLSLSGESSWDCRRRGAADQEDGGLKAKTTAGERTKDDRKGSLYFDKWRWVKTNRIPFGGTVGAPPILEPILVRIGMFTGSTGF